MEVLDKSAPMIPEENRINPDVEDLVVAVELNDFDIVGLAEFPEDDDDLRLLALRELWDIVRRETPPQASDQERLALVLFGMTRVAQEHYAEDGHQTYWPQLFEEIEQSVWAESCRPRTEPIRTQPRQELLGEWYLLALRVFGYAFPAEGQKYLGPIVFHSGVPRTSLDALLDAVATGVTRYGVNAVALPTELRGSIVDKPGIHINLRRLLDSDLLAAEQVWASLSRVFLAASCGEDYETLLRQLPTVIDLERVRSRLLCVSKGVARKSASALIPRVRYCVDSGEVRVFTTREADYRLTDASGEDLHYCEWQEVMTGRSALCSQPFPEQFRVSCDAGDAPSLSVTTRPESWPGIWFRASNGLIEHGKVVDANGLRPGRWFALIEGTPESWSDPDAHRVQLSWSSWSRWTAWEVNVPSADHEHEEVTCVVGGRRFALPISRRVGPGLERLTSPLAVARNQNGEEVDVYAEAPAYRLTRKRPIAAVLSRLLGGALATVGRLELGDGEEWRPSDLQPGTYQLHEARGLGRLLAQFAILPDAQFGSPEYEDDCATVRCVAETSLGNFNPCGRTIERSRGVFGCTTESPSLDLVWHWSDGGEADSLDFSWPLAGLRWRVLGNNGEVKDWTRDTVIISPKWVREHSAILEVQGPAGDRIRINDRTYDPPSRHLSPSWGPPALKLHGFTGGGGGQVEVAVSEDSQYLATLITNRPQVTDVSCEFADKLMCVKWQGTVSTSQVELLVWSPLDPTIPPQRIDVTEEDSEEREVLFEVSTLPIRSRYAVAICHKVKGGFAKRNRSVLAADASCPDEPAAFWVPSDFEVDGLAEETAEAAIDWLLDATTLAIDEGPRGEKTEQSLMAQLSRQSGSAVALAVIDRCQFSLKADGIHPDLLKAAWGVVLRSLSSDPLDIADRVSEQGIAGRLTLAALQDGVDLGATAPSRWLGRKVDLRAWSAPYPFELVRDLHLVSRSDELRLEAREGFEAADRVRRTLSALGLEALVRLFPMSNGPLRTAPDSAPVSHEFDPQLVVDGSAEMWTGLLGQDELGVDAFATHRDHYWSNPHASRDGVWLSPEARRHRLQHTRRQDPEYSLFWEPSTGCWHVDRFGSGGDSYRAEIGGPMLVKLPTTEKLVESCSLRDVLKHAAELDGPTDVDVDPVLASRLDEMLLREASSRSLHRCLLEQPEFVQVDVLGSTVSRRNENALPFRSRIAWTLAWTERSRFGVRGDLPEGVVDAVGGDRESFTRLLGEVCEAWPQLMHRALTVAEFLIWTVFRGGVGVAARFDRTLME